MDTFEDKCKNAVTGADLMEIAEVYDQILHHAYNMCDNKDNCIYYTKHNVMDAYNVKTIYNDYIGWALPTEKACQLVVDKWQKNPNRRIVDLGAGTGAFCSVFNHLGVPADKLIAVDIENPTHTGNKSSVRKEFWPIVRDNDYQVNSEDILFIAWGTTGIDDIVDDYVERDGKCIIILGETNVTYDPEEFIDRETDKPKENWIVDLHHVPGALSIYAEQLSINTNIKGYPSALLWVLVDYYNRYMNGV